MGLFSRALTIRTSLSPVQIHETLSRLVKPGGLFSFDLPRKTDAHEFRGKVRTETFDIVSRSQFRNSFVPVIHADVKPIENGSELSVTLSLHLYMLTFVIVWFICSVMGIALVVNTALELEEPLGAAWSLAALPFGGLAIAWVGFRIGIEPALQFLRMHLPPFIPPIEKP